MDTNLAQLYFRLIEPSDSGLLNQAGDEILQEYEKRESLLEIIRILTMPDMHLLIKKSASVGLKKVITNHLDFLLTDVQGQSVLNSFIQVLGNESNPDISSLIIFALNPVFEKVGDSWSDLTQFMSALLGSVDPHHIVIGLQLLTEFIPYAQLQFVCQILPTIVDKFIQSALSSSEITVLMLGLKLFSSILSTEIPIQEFSNVFSAIFQRILQIFHQLLVEENRYCSEAANYITESLKGEILFAPPATLFQALLQILSNGSIPCEVRHLPLFPVKKLIKNHGEELHEFFPQSIQLFLSISAQQFDDIGYEHNDRSQTISSLVKEMADSSPNPDELIACIFQNVSDENDASSSFALICSFIGLVDSSCDQIENYIEKIVQYAISRIQLQNLTLIQACFKLLADLIKSNPDLMLQFAPDICNYAFQLFRMQCNDELIKCSLDLIVTIFYTMDLEPSFVIESLPNVLQEYQKAPQTLKSSFMNCISSAILSCREDSVVFADTIIPIVLQGVQPGNVAELDNRASCIEALGGLLTFAPEKCQEIYGNAIQLILSSYSETDLALRMMCLKSLINIIKFAEGNVSVDFTPYAAQIAIDAVGQKVPDGDVLILDDSSYTIEDLIVDGFKLLRFLMKYHFESCQKFGENLPAIFTDAIINSSSVPIKTVAIHTSSQFVIKFNPANTDIYDILFKIITETNKKQLVISSFNSFKKILERSHNQLVVPNFGRFVDAALACLAHQLPFQCSGVKYSKKVSQSLVSFFDAVMKTQFQAFPAQKFVETISSIIGKISDKETFAILEILSTYILENGVIIPELVQFGASKLELCDFSHGHEPITFMRTIIQKQPQLAAQYIAPMIQLFTQRLTAEPVSTQYYWPTITNIISTIFTIINSTATNANDVQPEQFMGAIFAKLPVKGDFAEAQYIYSSILNLIRNRQNQMMQFVPEILRVFCQTLSLKKSKFEQFDLDQDTVDQMINSVKSILAMQPNFQEQIPLLLGNDQLKVHKLLQNLNSA